MVCADSDGQHRMADIRQVAGALHQRRTDQGWSSMVLGSRSFTGNVPARGRFGNRATRMLFTMATGEHIPDTQTCLRGYPAAMIPWLQKVRAYRYEYQLNLLLEARNAGYSIQPVDIATVYLDHNSSSHFRPMA